ncbi:NAC domain-containing protein 96-like [Oryza brachyantha]|uniref:NAC domain-containing protein 96-like n=1 Tax=Oryza brachyantha TaxID=4533 RepID=UPI001ADC3911|nr:NAC domain-containing protein 96-like [Oryza brachyantha]
MAAASRSHRRCSAPRRRDDEMEVHPSEQELVETYLRPRVVSGDKGSSVSGFVHEADVYSADPAELTRRFTPAVARSNGDEAWYFFSAVRGLKGGRRRRARTVGDGAGWWHSEAGARPVLGASGRILGHRQSFSFITKDDDGKRVRSGWLMVEFGVDDDEELVLSKDILMPSPPRSPPPRSPSPRREPIDMPEIREFFTRGPYRGSPPPRPYYDPPLMAPVDDDKQQQLANQDADYSHCD